MNYIEAEAYLNSLQFHKIKLGLDAMRSFLERVHRPETRLKFVHIAGTNGKGSTAAIAASILANLPSAWFWVSFAPARQQPAD